MSVYTLIGKRLENMMKNLNEEYGDSVPSDTSIDLIADVDMTSIDDNQNQNITTIPTLSKHSFLEDAM